MRLYFRGPHVGVSGSLWLLPFTIWFYVIYWMVMAVIMIICATIAATIGLIKALPDILRYCHILSVELWHATLTTVAALQFAAGYVYGKLSKKNPRKPAGRRFK